MLLILNKLSCAPPIEKKIQTQKYKKSKNTNTKKRKKKFLKIKNKKKTKENFIGIYKIIIIIFATFFNKYFINHLI